MRFQTMRMRTKISRTDRIIIGCIVNELRKEFGKDVNFIQAEKKADRHLATAKQLIYYFSAKFAQSSTQVSLSKLFHTSPASIILGIKAINETSKNNEIFSSMVELIDKRIKCKILSKLTA